MDENGMVTRVYLDLPIIKGKTKGGQEFYLHEHDGHIVVLAYGNVYVYEAVEIREKGENSLTISEKENFEPWELDAEEDMPDDDTIF